MNCQMNDVTNIFCIKLLMYTRPSHALIVRNRYACLLSELFILNKFWYFYHINAIKNTHLRFINLI